MLCFSRLLPALLMSFTLCLALPAIAIADDLSALGCSEQLPAGVTNLSDPSFNAEIERLVNEHRVARGLVPLKPDARLARAATWKARDVVGREAAYVDGIGHPDPGAPGHPSRQPWQRAMTCGHTTAYAWENLMRWLPADVTARAVLNNWLSSPGHRAQIERAEHRYFGTGSAISTTETFPGEAWKGFAQLFSSERSQASPDCGEGARSLRPGQSMNVDLALCRSYAGPTIIEPVNGGSLAWPNYRAPMRAGMYKFTVLWPDTGVRQSMMMYVQAAASRAALAAPACRAGRCTAAWTLRRPASPAARARLVVQKRVGSQWITHRIVYLPASKTSGRAGFAPGRGSFRARVAVTATPAQSASVSAWRSFRSA